MKQTRQSLAELAAGMPRFPQELLNDKVKNRFDPGANAVVRESVRAIEAELKQDGRVVLRASGTEPVIRVMLEGRDENVIRLHAERLAQIVSNAAAA